MPQNKRRALTMAQTRAHASIWTLNLIGYSKIAQQYYCELHKKRPQALLGSTDFNLPYEMTKEGNLRVRREDFKKLEALVREKIIKDPSYVNQLISSRHKRLEILKKNLIREDALLQSGCEKNYNPLQTFSHLTDFACFYIEYNFPFSLFKEMIVEKLNYSEEAYENLRLRLLTPCESAYLTYYRAVLKLALQKLNNSKIDLWYFRQQIRSISDRELKNRSNQELEESIERIVLMFPNRALLRSEIMKISAVEYNIKAEHAEIKKELLNKCSNQEAQTRNLIIGLSDMLIDAALENEQTSIWRGRVFAYLSCLIGSLGLNPHTVSVEEIQSCLNGARLQK